MRRFAAILSVLGFLIGGFEFVTDYGEVLEGTPLAAMPDGHDSNDGHDAAEHGLSCDSCHFGGVHLMGFAVPSLAMLRLAVSDRPSWQAPDPARVVPARRYRPPIA